MSLYHKLMLYFRSYTVRKEKGSEMVPNLVTIATSLLMLSSTILTLIGQKAALSENCAIEHPFKVLISTFSNGGHLVTKMVQNRTMFS